MLVATLELGHGILVILACPVVVSLVFREHVFVQNFVSEYFWVNLFLVIYISFVLIYGSYRVIVLVCTGVYAHSMVLWFRRLR